MYPTVNCSGATFLSSSCLTPFPPRCVLFVGQIPHLCCLPSAVLVVLTAPPHCRRLPSPRCNLPRNPSCLKTWNKVWNWFDPFVDSLQICQSWQFYTGHGHEDCWHNRRSTFLIHNAHTEEKCYNVRKQWQEKTTHSWSEALFAWTAVRCLLVRTSMGWLTNCILHSFSSHFVVARRGGL